MTVMAPEVAPSPARALDEILADLLSTAGLDRVHVYAEGVAAGYSASLVADHCDRCQRNGVPWVVTFAGLFRHLVEVDSGVAIKLRGRWHTPELVTPWDDEQPGYGQALGRGPAS